MFKLDGKILPLDRAFTTSDGTQYPSNWLRLSSAEEKTAIGIVEEADPVRADDRYYWNGDSSTPKALDDVNEVDAEGNPVYVQEYDAETESMVDTDEQVVTRGLKYTMTAQVKDTANKLLATTDWYVTRKAENDTAIPADVTTERSAIRTECARLETAISGAADVPALIAVMQSQNWPNQGI